MSKPKIIVVVGPTASGKTDLAIELALKFNGEIISADSRQFYIGMDIGTAKVTSEEIKKAPHHLVNFLTPDQPTNVFDFQNKAFVIIEDILKRGKLPILVGGTGLFISAVVENYTLSEAPVNQELRNSLEKLSLEEKIKKLLEFNPDINIDFHNERRVARQLELYILDPSYTPDTAEPKYDTLMIMPNIEKEVLHKKINARVEKMFEDGLTTEVENLSKKYGWEAHGMNAIGYREFTGMYDIKNAPTYKLEEIKEDIKKNTRQLAKRQMTWFRRYKDIFLHQDLEATFKKVSEFLI